MPPAREIGANGPAFRYPRPYVQACCKGTLGLAYEGDRIKFKALTCGSWSCPHCRKALATRLLDRIRRGMEARPGWKRTFVTLTIDPSKFGAVVIGRAPWDKDGKPIMRRQEQMENERDQKALLDLLDSGKVRETNLWSQPTKRQFEQAMAAMSKEFTALCKRLNAKAKYMGMQRFQYFRVTELHRNGWPHQHALFEHPELGKDDIKKQLDGWQLGLVDARSINIDDAVGELAPYLTSSEAKGGGSKAYQFAAPALPKNFRLYTTSQGFLGPKQESTEEKPITGTALPGHFTDYRRMYEQWIMAHDIPSYNRELVHVPNPGPLQLPPSKVPLLISPSGQISGFELSTPEANIWFADLLERKALKEESRIPENLERPGFQSMPMIERSPPVPLENFRPWPQSWGEMRKEFRDNWYYRPERVLN